MANRCAVITFNYGPIGIIMFWKLTLHASSTSKAPEGQLKELTLKALARFLLKCCIILKKLKSTIIQDLLRHLGTVGHTQRKDTLSKVLQIEHGQP